MKLARCLLLCLSLSTTATAIGQPSFAVGDVIVTTQSIAGYLKLTYRLLWYDANGRFKGQLFAATDQLNLGDAQVLGTAFSSAGELYVATVTGIIKVRADGTSTPFTITNSGASPSSLTFAADGTLYAGAAPAALHFAASGAQVGNAILPNFVTTAGIDLAADQCSLFYLTLNSVASFDVCRDVPLSILATFPGSGVVVTGLRIMPDGTFLVANGKLFHLGQTGVTLRQYSPDARVVALTPAADAAWIGSAGKIAQVNLTTGNVTIGPVDTGMEAVTAVSTFGEPRAALTSTPIAAIPAFSPWALTVVALMLALVGALSVRW